MNTGAIGSIHLRDSDALLVVDVQNDFLPGGTLAVPHGDEVLDPLNDCIKLFAGRNLPIIATRDWHPAGHCSFKAQGGPWPPHCVAGTPGAALATRLALPSRTVIVSKAQRLDRDAYSGFDGTELREMLRCLGATRLFIGGLATDYCVLATVRDARRFGFEVVVLTDAVRAVEVAVGDGERAIGQMASLGALLRQSSGIAA